MCSDNVKLLKNTLGRINQSRWCDKRESDGEKNGGQTDTEWTKTQEEKKCVTDASFTTMAKSRQTRKKRMAPKKVVWVLKEHLKQGNTTDTDERAQFCGMTEIPLAGEQ